MRILPFLLILLILPVLASAGAVQAACPVDGARYVLRDSPEFSARFRRVAEARSAHELMLDIHSTATGRTYSFTINRGNGYGEATLAPTTGDLAGPVEIYTVDEADRFTDYFGDQAAPAPERLLIPKLGPVLWYQVDELTGVGNSERERMPRAFFDRVACGLAKP